MRGAGEFIDDVCDEAVCNIPCLSFTEEQFHTFIKTHFCLSFKKSWQLQSNVWNSKCVMI